MSKTRGNGIALRATDDETAALIRRAPTDSERHIRYDPLTRPAVANLLDLPAATTGEDLHRLADDIANGGARRLKQTLTETVNELLRPLRQRRAAWPTTTPTSTKSSTTATTKPARSPTAP